MAMRYGPLIDKYSVIPTSKKRDYLLNNQTGTDLCSRLITPGGRQLEEHGACISDMQCR